MSTTASLTSSHQPLAASIDGGSPSGAPSVSSNFYPSHQEGPSGRSETPQSSKTTARQTFIHLVKGYIGPGCLSLPWAFSQLGIGPGVVACGLLSFWSSYNCWTVVKLKRKYLPLKATYPQVGAWAYGQGFATYVQTCICVQQLAICTVFFSFIGENLGAILPNESNHLIVMTLALPAILGLSCLANLKALVPFTTAGTVLLFSAFALLAYVMAQEWNTENDPNGAPSPSARTVPLAICAILYSYEGICLILPIEGAMEAPKEFGPVFGTAMATVAVVFCLVAGSSVKAFGTVTNGSITAYLLDTPEFDDAYRGPLVWANFLVSLSVLLTYPLQLFPALELMGRGCGEGRTSSETIASDVASTAPAMTVASSVAEPMVVAADENGEDFVDDDNNSATSSSSIPGDSPQLRLGLVLLTYMTAMVIPNVQSLIALAGAVAGSSTALLIPPLLELRDTTSMGERIRCYLLFGGGVLFMLIGTIAATTDIVRIYRQS